MADLAGLHHAALTVRDCAASARWYQDVLGLELAFTEPGDTRRACVLRFPGTPFGIGLVEFVGSTDAGFDPARLGLDHLAFTVATRAELDAWAERLTAHGIDHSGAIDVPPGAILNFKDPDGIALALFWDAA